MKEKISIELTATEMLVASQHGAMRHIQDIKKGRNDVFGARQENGWQLDIEGAMGEYAVAKVFDVFWNGNIGDLSAPDVGKIQVRTTHHVQGRLILHKPPKDSPTDYFILVTGINGKYAIRGGVYGHEGMRDELWKDPTGQDRHAYFVPQDMLDDIETTIEIFERINNGSRYNV